MSPKTTWPAPERVENPRWRRPTAKPIRGRYPRAEWMQLDVAQKITRGVHFTCRVESMLTQLRRWARDEGLEVKAERENGESIVFLFWRA